MLKKTTITLRQRAEMPIPYQSRAGYDQESRDRLRAAARIDVEKVGDFYVFGVHTEKYRNEIGEWVAEHLAEKPLAANTAMETAEIAVPVDGWWFMRHDVVVTSKRNLAFDLLRNVLFSGGRAYRKAHRQAKLTW